MKRYFKIGIVFLLILLISSCSPKYTSTYCDFEIGNFEGQGYYLIKSFDELSKFKQTHQTTSDFNKKLNQDKDYFNSKYLIVVVMPDNESNVSYSLEDLTYKDNIVNLKIKKNIMPLPDAKPDTDNKPENPGTSNDSNNNGTNPGTEGNDSNNGQNSGTPGDGSNTNRNNNIFGGLGRIDGANNSNGGASNEENTNNDAMNPGDNDSTNDQIPNDTLPSTTINKGYILEFKKSTTVTKVNITIV